MVPSTLTDTQTDERIDWQTWRSLEPLYSILRTRLKV